MSENSWTIAQVKNYKTMCSNGFSEMVAKRKRSSQLTFSLKKLVRIAEIAWSLMQAQQTCFSSITFGPSGCTLDCGISKKYTANTSLGLPESFSLKAKDKEDKLEPCTCNNVTSKIKLLKMTTPDRPMWAVCNSFNTHIHIFQCLKSIQLNGWIAAPNIWTFPPTCLHICN